MRFEGQAGVISGAAGNLGKAVAARLAAEGASLVLLDRNQARAESLASALPGRHLGLAVDLLDRQATAEALETGRAALGEISIACALAGGFAMGETAHEASEAAWEKMQALNVGTLLSLLAAVTPAMIAAGRGKIVTVGANGALTGVPAMGPYCAAKSAVMRITESAAAELKGHGIQVNGVLPSIIDTPQNREAMPDADPGAWVAPEKLAAAIAFLASPDADAVYGALLPVVGRG